MSVCVCLRGEGGEWDKEVGRWEGDDGVCVWGGGV